MDSITITTSNYFDSKEAEMTSMENPTSSADPSTLQAEPQGDLYLTREIARLDRTALQKKRLSGAAKKRLTKERKMAEGTWVENRPKPKAKGKGELQTPIKPSTKRPSLDGSTPQSEEERSLKRAKPGDRQGPSFSEALSAVKMAVVVEGYPDQKLSEDQLMDFQMDAMSRIEGVPPGGGPRFEYCRLEAGAIVILCADSDSCQWLTRTVREMSPWNGLSLLVGEAKSVIKTTKIIVELPAMFSKFSGQEILQKVETQNGGLTATEWGILNQESGSEGRTIVFSVTEQDAKTLDSRGCKFYLGFTQVQARVLEKPAAASSGNAAEASADDLSA